MKPAEPNPYAPPVTVSEAVIPLGSMRTLEAEGPIRFSGSLQRRDLDEFLQTDGHVGFMFLILLGLCVGLISLVFVMQGGGLAAIAIGTMGLFATASIVSTVPYRRLVFESANPLFRHACRGSLRADGVHLDRGDVRAFFRWDWYWNAVVSENLVAFLPATQPMQPLLVTRSMLHGMDEWQRVLEVAGAITKNAEDSYESDVRRKNLRILRDKHRARSVDLSSDAVPFQGTLRTRDFAGLTNEQRLRERPPRSYAVIGALFGSGALIVAGASNLIFQRFAFLPAFVALYAAIAAIGIAVRKRRRPDSNRDAVYHVNGLATESSVVSDFGITRTTVGWPALHVAARSDDFVALRRRQRSQFIVVRRDMFSGQQDWQRFNRWVDR